MLGAVRDALDGPAASALDGVGGAATVSLAGPAAAQGAALLKLLLALGVVLLAFWVCARLLGRFGRSSNGGAAGLTVLGSVALGQRERLVVVQAGATRLVLGVTAQGIVPVHVMDGADRASVPSPAPAAPAGGATGLPGDFADRLRAALGRPVS